MGNGLEAGGSGPAGESSVGDAGALMGLDGGGREGWHWGEAPGGSRLVSGRFEIAGSQRTRPHCAYA